MAIEQPVIDSSGNCGNLSAAVGPFAISRGMVRAPRDGLAIVRIWQANIGKVIVAHVPVEGGEVAECGDFVLDGVPFPGAAVTLEFLDPAGDGDDGGDASISLFPTGRTVDTLASGVLAVGATVGRGDDGAWMVTRVVMSRSARRLMEGAVFVPDVGLETVDPRG